MRIAEYKDHLRSKSASEEAIRTAEEVIVELANFLSSHGLDTGSAVGRADVEQFARWLITERRNTTKTFVALRDYAVWLGNRSLYVALVELMDCRDAMARLAELVESRHGREVRDRIFREPLPPLGAGERERSAHTRTITARMEELLPAGDRQAAWFQVQHGMSPSDWRETDTANERTFRRCRSIDEYLQAKRKERNELLTRLRDEGGLWYTTAIDNDALAFITGDPEIEGGRRDGDNIYITKVPYNTVRYLRESDRTLKRYYACHCPLVREAILQAQPISPDVCECSLGWSSHLIAPLGRPYRAEVLESAVRGDIRCRFVFTLLDEGAAGVRHPGRSARCSAQGPLNGVDMRTQEGEV
jgi:hypothetical protein